MSEKEYFAATIPARVWQDKRLSLNDMRVLLALISFNGGGVCNPKLPALIERANLCKQRIHEAKIRLKDYNWISETEEGYSINFDNSIEEKSHGKRDPKVTESVTSSHGKRDPKVTESVTGGHGKRDPKVTESVTGLYNMNEIENKIKNEIEKKGADDAARISFLQTANQLIDFLNSQANKHFRHTQNNRKNIIARLKENYSQTDCEFVIENQTRLWLGTDMEPYLNPETLFRPTKFEKYLNTKKFVSPKQQPPNKSSHYQTIAQKNAKTYEEIFGKVDSTFGAFGETIDITPKREALL